MLRSDERVYETIQYRTELVRDMGLAIGVVRRIAKHHELAM